MTVPRLELLLASVRLVLHSSLTGHAAGRRVRRSIRSVLAGMAAVLLATAALSSTAAAQGDGAYPDVPADAYYAAPVRTLDADGVFAGTLCNGGFCPDESIDRKTMAVWTVRVMDGQDPPAVSRTRFEDVQAAGFHARFIERMAELGVTSGCGDGDSFCPDRTVTRAQMAVFLSRAFDLPDGPAPDFSDVSANAWYASDVARLTASGITVGCRDGTEFCPGRETTRAQMATFLHRAKANAERQALALQRDALAALYEATGGPNWGDRTNWLSSSPLGDWYGVDTGSSGSVTRLDLSGNRLSGRVPSELSGLTSLTGLDLGGNGDLSGPLPASLTALSSLADLNLEGTGMCTRTDAAFQAWLGGVTTKRGVVDCTSDAVERAALTALYNGSGGSTWVTKTGWLSSSPLGDWYGVDTGSGGRVTRLDLSGNGLGGEVPSVLSDLAGLTALDLAGNGSLSGRLPASFTALASLEDLRLAGTGLCAPMDAAFQAWLGSITIKGGVVGCVADSPDWPPLVALYNATDGPNWVHNTNWLSNAPLEDWHGVSTDTNGRVTSLGLSRNRLSGQIPSGLSGLTSLTELFLDENRLSGRIPSGLSGLTDLTWLNLGNNELSGQLPPQLSELDLTYLSLSGNGDITGPLPASFTALTSLDYLWLDRTGLCAPTDAAFQEWLRGITNKRGLTDCVVDSPDRPTLVALYNATDGPNWTNKTNWLSSKPVGTWYGVDTGGDERVTQLSLSGNGLSGEVPSGLSDLAELAALDLGGNGGLSGRLPASLTSLSALGTLTLDGTELCAPMDAAFQEWLGGITNKGGVVDCVADSPDWPGLVALYNATDGPNWGNKTNWLTNTPLGDWYGVDTGNDGRVTRLSLSGNRMSGLVPPELSALTSLTDLFLGDNGNLLGPLPASFTALASLDDLRMDGTALCAPTDTAFQQWLGGVTNRRGVVDCASDAHDRAALAALYNATDGANWAGRTNWLSNRSLDDWFGVETDSGRVTELSLSGNRLSGPIPSELSGLANLTALDLGENQLSGQVPPELSGLTGLTDLDLGGNGSLSGRLPDSFTALSALDDLRLAGTGLCAPMDVAFQAWLGGVTNRSGVVDCVADSPDWPGLVALYNATDGPNWDDNTDWLTNTSLEDWYGIDTGINGRVTQLSLSGNELGGQIPSGLSVLVDLTDLDLSGNRLGGQIPSGLSALVDLTGLDLSGNRLGGQIPSGLSSLVDLEDLDLSDNRLTGQVPSELSALTSLTDLDLGDNPSLSGPLPGSFTALAALDDLRLDGTGLCAPTDTAFQEWLEDLTNKSGVADCVTDPPDRDVLVGLYNATDGANWDENTDWLTNKPLGDWYGVTTDDDGRVTDLSLGNNGLVGQIPSGLADLVNLTSLSLSSNALTGEIPSELSDLANLTELELGFNRLSGEIPSELSDLTGLTWLGLNNNGLSGEIPSGLSDLTDLVYLNIRVNPGISGRLPTSFTALTSLETFRMDGTGLCAPADTAFQAWLRALPNRWIPHKCASDSPDYAPLVALYNATDGSNWDVKTNWLTNLPLENWYGVSTDSDGRVAGLALSSNGLSGKIPSRISGLTNLAVLNLRDNSLSGEIPSGLSDLTSLTELNLGDNSLTGRIPSGLADLTDLTHLNLGDNSLGGEIPSELSDLTDLTHLVLGGNSLSGEIPSDLSDLSDLKILDLGGNGLSGAIPSDLSDLTNLTHLDLGGNGLSGAIPSDLSDLTKLLELDLADNGLSGQVPSDLSDLTKLRELFLDGNASLSGPLPGSFTALVRLYELRLDGTGVCAPTDPTFQEWLRYVEVKEGVADCPESAA